MRSAGTALKAARHGHAGARDVERPVGQPRAQLNRRGHVILVDLPVQQVLPAWATDGVSGDTGQPVRY